MSVDFAGVDETLFCPVRMALCRGSEWQRKYAPSTAHPEGGKRWRLRPLFCPFCSPFHINAKLTVELVPQSCWFSTVRDHVSTEQGEPLTETNLLPRHTTSVNSVGAWSMRGR